MGQCGRSLSSAVGYAAVVGASVLVLAGCGKSEPSASNFEKLINGTLGGTKICTWAGVLDRRDAGLFLPNLGERAGEAQAALAAGKAQIITYVISDMLRKPIQPNAQQVALFQALQSNGMLIGDIYPFQPPVHGLFDVSGKVMAAVINEAGLKHFTEKQPEFKWESVTSGKFCYAEAAVGKIVRWTNPSNQFGYTVTSVEYTIEPKNIASWAKSLREFSGKETHKRDLVLTNEGWSADLSIVK